MLKGIIKNQHFPLLPVLGRVAHSQVALLFLWWDEQRKVEPEFDVAGSVVRSYLSLWSHAAEERVAEGRSCHEVRPQRLQDARSDGAVLLKHGWVFLALCDVVHPVPSTLVQSLFALHFFVVVSVGVNVGLAQLYILLLHSVKVVLEL